MNNTYIAVMYRSAVFCFIVFVLFPFSSLSIPFKGIDSLKEAINKVNSDSDKIKILVLLSETIACSDTGKVRYANDALQLAQKTKWSHGIIIANIQLGIIHQNCIRNNSRAIAYFQKAATYSGITNDISNKAIALNGIAIAYLNLSQYSKALNYFKQVFALKSSTEMELGTLGNMGVIYTNIGDYPKALACYDSSLRLLNELKKKASDKGEIYTLQMAGLLIAIGDIHVAMTQYDKALDNYNAALKLTEQVENKVFKIDALMAIGKTYYVKKDNAKAIEFYTQALENCKKFNDQQNEPAILNQLSNIYREQSDLKKALEYALASQNIAEEKNYLNQLPVTYTTLGKIFAAKKNYKVAIQYLQKAITICTKNCAIVNERDAWEALSNIYTEMRQPARALDAFKRFIVLRDSIYNTEKAKELTRIGLQYQFDQEKQAQTAQHDLDMQRQRIFTYSGFGGLLAVLLLSFFIYRSYNHQKKANVAISRANEAMSEEKQKADGLLRNILPEDVAKELKTHGNVHARRFDNVTVIFTDFVNFTEAGVRFSPEELVAELHTCFMAFDRIMGRYNIEKIKTVGDAYLAVSGLPYANPNHAKDIIKAAIECRDFMVARRKKMGDLTFAMRVGINSGTVVAGIVGSRKFAYDIWGDTVNTAARMEQYSDPDKINISQETYELVKNDFACTDRGEIDAKHKGKMRMYFVEHKHA
ncbi:MAG: hypothetical protein K0Q79_2988 [Flavipsychrobacter sp.]|jgi:class 3 adenylate cyclase/glutaredoxin-related protein|nr:hypothetical protein [Flavipsychrobacter sp.]